MRDIRPGRKNRERDNLPPLEGGDYKELERYEASRAREVSSKPNVRRRESPNKKARMIRGSTVPVTKAQFEEQKLTEKPKRGQLSRKTFANASLPKPGKARVGQGERKAVLGLLGLVVMAAAIAAVIFLPTADINIRLRTAPLLVDDKVLIGSSEDGPEAVPGTSFFREISLSGTYRVINTAVVGEKSRGEVELVNKTLDEQQIKARSRLETASGVLFYMEKHAIVPADSRVTVAVEAAEEGEAGNIEPQKLTFVALDEAAKSVVYAEAKQAFTGGSGETVAVVSEDDLRKAKEEAGKAARAKAQEQIKNELPEGWAILEESWDIGLDEFITKQEVGERIPVIEYQAKVTARVMGYEKEVFEEKMKEKLESRISEDYMLFPGPVSYMQSVDEVRWEDAQAMVAIKVTHSTIPKISLDSMKEKLAGRTEDEAKEYLEGLPGVRSASLQLWPFWVRSIPRIEQRIEITLEPEKKI